MYDALSAASSKERVLIGLWRGGGNGVKRSLQSCVGGVRLIGPDSDKLIALTDALLFYCQVARLRTRPVTISEAEGCVGITWSRYAPAAFRNSRMLELIAAGQQIDYLTVQESRAA